MQYICRKTNNDKINKNEIKNRFSFETLTKVYILTVKTNGS